MYSFKPEKRGSNFRFSGAQRSFLVLLLGLLTVGTAHAQTYDWKPVKIGGSGFVTGADQQLRHRPRHELGEHFQFRADESDCHAHDSGQRLGLLPAAAT
jgi:hypothetical protein